MIKVMIVDDEIWVRESLKLAIEWEKYGFCIVAEAENADEATELFPTVLPDIVITDIRMGDTDGLDFLKTLYEKKPEIVRIILSGYRDFDYAQRAIQNGVSAYLVKPIDDDDLLRVLLAAKEKIENLQKKADKPRLFDEQFINISKTYLQKLCLGEFHDTKQIAESLAYFGVLFPQDPFYLAYIKPDPNKTDMAFPATNMLEKSVSDAINRYRKHSPYSTEVFSLPDATFVLLISVTGEKGLNFSPLFLLNTMQSIQSDVHDCTVSIGLSETHTGLDSLPVAFDEASSALKNAVSQNGKNLVYCGNTKCFDSVGEWKTLDSQKIIQAINDVDYEKCTHLLHTFFDRVTLQKQIHLEQLQNYVAESFVLIIHSIFHNSDDIEKVFGKDFQPFAEVLNCQNANDIKQWILQCFNTLFMDPNIYLQYSYRPEIQFAITRIRESYSTHITLEQLAEEINISVFHFSRLFKSETGMTFNQFLTNYRINVATNLLMEGNYRIYEVGAMVGYSNIDHFIRCFKKIHQCTPKKFQRQNAFPERRTMNRIPPEH